jgi:two-component system, OmpR family, response regulator
MSDKKRILIVDDDIDFLANMKIRLEAAGYDVATADSEQSAMQSLEDQAPDLAILDLMMEHMDSGFKLAYRIKKQDKKIPVVMVTGVTNETGMMFGAATNGERSWIHADVVLDKPIRYEQLNREIVRLLKLNT